MVASFCFGLRQDKLGQEDWVEVTVLDFKTGSTILCKNFPLETSPLIVKLEAQRLVHCQQHGLSAPTASDFSFDAPVERDVVLRLTDEHMFCKLEAVAFTSSSLEAPHPSLLLAGGRVSGQSKSEVGGGEGEGGEIMGNVSLPCVIPRDDISLTEALNLVKVINNNNCVRLSLFV